MVEYPQAFVPGQVILNWRNQTVLRALSAGRIWVRLPEISLALADIERHRIPLMLGSSRALCPTFLPFQR